VYMPTGVGVFKSNDSGHMWRTANTGIVASGVSLLAVNPLTPTILYAVATPRDNSTISGLGIYRTTNAGDTWTFINIGPDPFNTFALAIDPATPTTLYLGAINGFYKSTDSGAHWTLANQTPSSLSVISLTIDPTNTST